MSDAQKKPFWQSVRDHETTIVEVAAVLTASTRWIITFSPIDKTNLNSIIASMGWIWDALSSVLSISFAVVEIWATAMIMRAFNIAKDRKDKFFLGGVWFVSLVVLALVQIPPLYASLMDVPVASLDGWNALYVVATSVAAFVVIAGVSYSDRFKTPRHGEGEDSGENWKEDFTDVPSVGELQQRVNDLQEMVGTKPQLPTEFTPALSEPETPQIEAPKADTDRYKAFRDKILEMNGNAPKTGYAVAKMFGVTPKTGSKWLEKYHSEKESA